MSETLGTFEDSNFTFKLFSCFRFSKSFVKEFFESIAKGVGLICNLLLLGLFNLMLKLLNLFFPENNGLSLKLIISFGLRDMCGLLLSFFRKLRSMLISSIHKKLR